MFVKEILKYKRDVIQSKIVDAHQSTVESILQRDYFSGYGLNDFATLISPAAFPFLEEMLKLSQRITQERFGKNIQLFIPMYLSNECQNICTYCGFSFTNKIPRKTLSNDEILKEIEIIKSYGYDNILLVTGEHDKFVGVDYLLNAVKLVKQHFSQVSIEVQPLEQHEYELLKDAGVYSVLVYQETYHKELYKTYHPKGKKSNFDYRLDTPDRLGKAGIHKIGLGVLLGLEDWRTDSYFNALHLDYLQKTYWQTKYSVSFPRIRPHEGDFMPKSEISEKELAQLICAYRICFPDVELSLSSRERAQFRDIVFPYGITSMSAGSKTEPGGYSNSEALKQFETSDERLPQEIAAMIRSKNYEPVWKDWDAVLI
ncbi:MAG: 2-iminoacetate synthase ThiH [Chitinophagales bacterium]